MEVVERLVPTAVPQIPTRSDWPRLLGELTSQLVDHRIYDRDLTELSLAMTAATDALVRRMSLRDRTTRRGF